MEKLYDIDPETCSEEELKATIDELGNRAGFFETQQLALKTFINSVYGATASEFFAGFNPAVAEAITLQGQDLNHYSEICVNEYFRGPFQSDTELHKKLGIDTELTKKIQIGSGRLTEAKPLEGPEFEYLGDNVSLVIAGDTDSTCCKSRVYVNNEEMTIEDAFNLLKLKNHDAVLKTSNGSDVVPVKDSTTLTFKDNQITERPIKYIMRHKVRKAKWKVKTKSGKDVIITNDHSIMVLRDNKLIKVKPQEIMVGTDKIITIVK